MVVILSFSTRGVLGGECFDYLLEVVERMSQHGVEPIRGHAFQTGWKGYAQERIVVGVNYHIVPKVPNVLNRITRSGIVVKSELQTSSGTRILKSLRRGESETLATTCFGPLQSCSLPSSICLWINSSRARMSSLQFSPSLAMLSFCSKMR